MLDTRVRAHITRAPPRSSARAGRTRLSLLKTAKPGVALGSMGTINRYRASRSLEAADLDVAARVYVEVVDRLALAVEDNVGRERVAEMIVRQLLLGERDPIQLRDDALADWERQSRSRG